MKRCKHKRTIVLITGWSFYCTGCKRVRYDGITFGKKQTRRYLDRYNAGRKSGELRLGTKDDYR